LEFCLKDAFGINDQLFNMVKFGTSSTKVAIIATIISEGALCILSNYNGVLERRKDCVLIDLSSIFLAKFIPAVGFIQDRGIKKYNNPINLIYWESCIAFNADPNLTVSISLGFT
ncbi:hypothetical protein V2W45_1228178, partial [Cenococcum geophilum]